MAFRLPWSHLEMAIRPDGGDPDHQEFNPTQTELYTVSYIARRINVTRETIYRYRREGVPFHSADRICIHINRHPAEVWPDEYLEYQP